MNLTGPQRLFYYLGKFVCLSPFDINNNKLRPVNYLGKLYSLALIVLSSLWQWKFYVACADQIRENSSGRLNYPILIIFSGGTTVVALYVFSFRSGDIIGLLDRIIAAECQLEKLVEERNKRSSFEILVAKILVTTTLILAMKIPGYVDTAVIDWTKLSPSFFWTGLVILLVHKNCTILIFVQTMIRMRKCFESLNESLRRVGSALTDDSPGLIFLVESRDRKNRCVDDRKVQTALKNVRSMRKLHHELNALVNSTVDLSATTIMLLIGFLFSNSLVCCYTMYTSITSSESLTLGPSFLSPVTTAVVIVLHLMLIAHACSSTCDAGNATKVEIHRVWNKYQPEALRDELFVFSVQLLRNPVAAKALGFFDLGYSYVYEIFYTVAAYLIVMIQLDVWASSKASARG